MRTDFSILLLISTFLFGCVGNIPQKHSISDDFEIHGHRGFRGKFPENSVVGMIEAIKAGANWIEMDVVVTKDNKLILSHEPFFNADICTTPNGDTISKFNQEKLNIYQMTYQEVLAYDCGLKIHDRFPNQIKIKTVKPLLEQVIDTVEKYCVTHSITPVNYNIEIKSEIGRDSVFHPFYKEYVDLLLNLIRQKNIEERCVIQSFDVRVLQYLNNKQAPVKKALLVENKLTVGQNLKELGFKPDIYSCYYQLLTQMEMKQLKSDSISVIPWTVNDMVSMETLIKMGVDGIISDYPDSLVSVVGSFKLQ